MSLSEERIKDNVKVEPYRMSCDDVICKSIKHPLPGANEGWFRMAVVGSSGSKSNLVQNLTQRGGKNSVYNKKFTNVFYISPSVKSMSRPPKLPEDRIDKYGFMFIDALKSRVYNKFDSEFIYG